MHTDSAYCKYIRCVILLILSITILCSCGRKREPLTRSALFFDTIIQITIYDSDLALSDKERLIDDCFALCAHYENTLSATVPESDIWNINHSTNPVPVEDDTLFLIERAIFYSELSHGLIDPTVYTAGILWDFTSEDPALPSKQALAEAVSHVDYHAIRIEKSSLPDQSTVQLADPEACMNLGFIAKGFVADQLGTLLRKAGVQSALINLGGNLLAIGSKPDGSDYLLGIQAPFSDTGEAITAIPCHDSSLVTSGNYERFFRLNGIVYHHILDSATGYPVQNDLNSVTILSSSSMQGDALSTLCYILGPDAGLALIESTEGVEALFIKQDNSVIRSSGFPCE